MVADWAIYSAGDGIESPSAAVQIGLSLGYAICPPSRLDLDELLATADAALYRMKRAGGGVALGDRDTVAA